MEGSRIMPTSSRFDQEAFAEELNRIIGGLAAAGDDDPRAAERRYARLSEADREELRCVRRAFANLDRACRSTRVPPAGRPARRIRFRLVGGRLVREEGDEEEEVKGKGKGKHEGVPTANGGVGESPSSSVAAAAGSEEEVEEDELCSAFRSACGASS
ncbi:Os12g0594100 [Oryza sativa Japonica Group]|uniref:Os12g0594100 protein n=3 Tax=Oryza TaxID=4527 RepID=Q2QMR7_ORYSJ|nr:hypothetical protein LOC_Os12g40270 [Oryza sativa Japonica Group]BAT17900.1 Os12g0594100 [Oryza sativa Japonica Group]